MSNEVISVLAKLDGESSGMTGAFDKANRAQKQMASDSKTASEESSGSFTKMSSNIGATLGKLAGVLGIAFGVGAVVDWGKKTVTALANIQALSAQTTAALTSTGASAWETADGVRALGDKLERMTGTESESIQKGANLLLTFKNIQNQAGKGNDIFDQSTAVMTNMARAMGTDASSSAIQLGKALNDPTKGISALTRVGVTFDEAQKKQIETMQKSGDIMGAQKIILKELNSEFGASGAAYINTYSGAVDVLHQSFQHFSEALLGGVMPALTSLAKAGSRALDWLTDNKSVQGFGGALVKGFEKLWKDIQPFVEAIGKTLGPIIQTLAPQLLQFSGMLSPIGLIFKSLTPVLPVITGLLQTLGSILSGALSIALPILTKLFNQLAGILTGVFKSTLPIIATLLADVGEVVSQLMPYFAKLASVLGGVFMTVLKAVAPILPILASAFEQIFESLMPLIPPVLKIVEAFLPLIKLVGSLVSTLLPPLISLFLTILKPILALIDPLVKLLTPALTVVADVLSTVIGWIVKGIGWLAKIIAQSIKTGAIGDYFKAMGDVVVAVISGIISAVKWVSDTITNAWNGIVAATKFLGDAFHTVFTFIGSVISSAFTGAVGIAKGAINGIISLVNGAIGAIDRLKISIPSWVPIIGGQTWQLSLPKLPMLATGSSNFSGGMAIVGERGPEVVKLPAGSQVIPNSQSAQAMGGGGGPTDLSDETIAKLARAMVAAMRVQSRTGAVTP